MRITIIVLLTTHTVTAVPFDGRLVAIERVARIADRQAVLRAEAAGIDWPPPPTCALALAFAQQPKQPSTGPRGAPDDKPREAVWLRGKVRDASGHGLAGARVFVRAGHHNFMRMYEEVRFTTTDGRGGYEIHGPAYPFTDPLSVVAQARGHPPAVATAPGRPQPNDGPATLDMTLADRGGAARIVVLKGGQPLANASVALTIERRVFSLSPRNYRTAARGPERVALEDVVSPTTQTGPDGVAQFSDLFPGLYAVDVVDSPVPGGAIREVSRSSGRNYARARGLGVAAGRNSEMTLAVLPEFRTVRFQVFRPDGRPVTDQVVGLQFGTGGTENVGGMLTLDGRGMGEFPFGAPGLWTVVVRFRDTPVNSFPVREAPYYEAEALLPVSPGQALAEPVRMVGVRREPGSLGVRMFETAAIPVVDIAGQQAMLGINGMGGHGIRAGEPDDPAVTVFLSDGTKPAFAAHALLYVPEHAEPVRSGVSDANGRLAWRSFGGAGNPAADGQGGQVDRPTLVVSLPGRHGATILPFEQGRTTRAVLPAPIVAEGRVTLGGRPPGRRDARIRVVAAYRGRGVVDAGLGIEVTASPDGRFTLPGLTPGHYNVQAARDGIWLSSPVALVAEAGTVPRPLLLDIPEPGEPVTLEFVDLVGRPIAGEPITLVSPKGPLSALWPTTYRTDAAGLLTLRGLTAGHHTISIPNATGRVPFQVRAAATVPTQPSLKRLIVQRPGP